MIDMDASYEVIGYKGIAWNLLGFVERDTPDTYWDGITETDESMVRAVMVGDDQVFEHDVSDLVLLDEDEFCYGCGQIGCGH